MGTPTRGVAVAVGRLQDSQAFSWRRPNAANPRPDRLARRGGGGSRQEREHRARGRGSLVFATRTFRPSVSKWWPTKSDRTRTKSVST